MNNIDNVKSHFPLLFDGAMGTYYIEKSEKPLPECEMANIFDKELVLNIQTEYLKSGATALKTNTFGANRRSLKCTPDVLKTIIVSGYQISLDAIEKNKAENGDDSEKYVFADIGPIPNEGLDEEGIKEIIDEYKEIVDTFLGL